MGLRILAQRLLEAVSGVVSERAPNAQWNHCGDLYLELMRRSLTNVIYGDGNILDGMNRPYDERLRTDGRDWPSRAHTMVGLKRLENVQWCVEDALRRGIPGDLIETGVWRGGTVILMRAILKVYGVTDRRVWVADSFEGLPPPNAEKYPPDAISNLHEFGQLAVSLEEVGDNFRRYGLLDEQVQFIKGWFRDTLPVAPIDRLAVLRVDGDLYESTHDALTHLYPKLQIGGYAIIDDFNSLSMCQRAVIDYRKRYAISDPVVPVDWSAAYWMKTGGPNA